jgi:23S rRNA (adenine2503-C2)-methyltransferase
MPFERPSPEEIDTFQRYLLDRGFVTTVRYSKGGEVSAACGQLAAKNSENLDKVPQRKWVIGG